MCRNLLPDNEVVAFPVCEYNKYNELLQLPFITVF